MLSESQLNQAIMKNAGIGSQFDRYMREHVEPRVARIEASYPGSGNTHLVNGLISNPAFFQPFIYWSQENPPVSSPALKAPVAGSNPTGAVPISSGAGSFSKKVV